MRRYEALRLARTALAQRAAERNGAVYHLGGIAGVARSLALMVLGDRLISRYDWLYGHAAA